MAQALKGLAEVSHDTSLKSNGRRSQQANNGLPHKYCSK